MVYNTQNYWVFAFCPSDILETRKRFRNRICSRPQVRGGRHLSVGLALSKVPNRGGIIPPPHHHHHQRTETDPVSETLCFLVSRILDDGQSPNT
jgi:hypothetical protein